MFFKVYCFSMKLVTLLRKLSKSARNDIHPAPSEETFFSGIWIGEQSSLLIRRLVLTFFNTVTQLAPRCGLQFVDKKAAAVQDIDLVFTATLIAAVDITDLTLDFALSLSGMLPLEPARPSTRTALSLVWCWFWNPVPSRPFKAVPFFFQVLITFSHTPLVVNRTVGVINHGVVAAFCRLCGWKSRIEQTN